MVIYKNNLDLNPCVLLVKTDEKFTQQASIDLRSAGYTTVLITDLQQGLEQLPKINPAMIVLDYTATKQQGANFCRNLRKQAPQVSLLLVLDHADLDERVICLDVGADDYVQKPYNSSQFCQFLAIYGQKKPKMSDQLHFGALVLELNSHRLVNNGEGIDLTTKEFELLKFFMSHPEEILTREQILENVWGYDFQGESNVIEVYIRYLRRKIEKEGHKRLLQTVRGLGYVLREC
jgi:DNA-binding response OmpR family regulator